MGYWQKPMTKTRYCGRNFTAAELDLIQSIIARPEEHPTRAAIARAVCQSLDWVKPDGGPKLTVLIVTDGSTTQYYNDKDILVRKLNQAQEANRILGSDEIIQWEFPDMRLDTVEHYKLNQAFESLIKKKGFDTVFTHNIDDINMDHQIIFKSVLVATRPTPGQTVKQLLSYYVNSSSEWGGYNERTVFCSNYYININE